MSPILMNGMNNLKRNRETMNKEFISYEQALALKELGFDELCFGYYNYKAEIKRYTNYDGELYNFQTLRNSSMNVGDNWCAAPLCQQAFRWFREKYNIQGYIYSSAVRGNAEKTKQFTGYTWNINGIDMPFLSTDARDGLHDTYEEAELECLNKLIEIVKNK